LSITLEAAAVERFTLGWGGWTLGSTAKEMAGKSPRTAVIAALAPRCRPLCEHCSADISSGKPLEGPLICRRLIVIYLKHPIYQFTGKQWLVRELP
jgi:hypothetical protein